jgi:ADP-ribose pyrophosphatase YjhB (NUDIX family)
LTVQLPSRTYAAAGGVVVDPASERVLVLLRPGREGPGALPEVRLPKGHVEPDESLRQAALREVAEEAGLSSLKVVADLGHQTVEFDWQGYHYIRQESYFLLALAPGAEPGPAEEQFERLWLVWEQALARLTFDAEQEWMRRAQAAWANTKQEPGTNPKR